MFDPYPFVGLPAYCFGVGLSFNELLLQVKNLLETRCERYVFRVWAPFFTINHWPSSIGSRLFVPSLVSSATHRHATPTDTDRASASAPCKES